MKSELIAKITEAGYWFEEDEDGHIVLNATSPYDIPSDFDPDSGEIMVVEAKPNSIISHWDWTSHGYAEVWENHSVKSWMAFYDLFMCEGIDAA